MTTNILETIQQNLQYPELQKIDPATQDIDGIEPLSPLKHFGQAAIPAVLTGLYKLSRSEEGAAQILSAGSGYSLNLLFEDDKDRVVEKVAQYGGVSVIQAESHMENISDEAIKLIRLAAGNDNDPKHLISFMDDQRNNILDYLPTALNLGNILEIDKPDESKNKIEATVLHRKNKIEEKIF
jgi:hypothetical protein